MGRKFDLSAITDNGALVDAQEMRDQIFERVDAAKGRALLMTTGPSRSTEERLESLNNSILNLYQIFDGALPMYLTNFKWFEIIQDLLIQVAMFTLK